MFYTPKQIEELKNKPLTTEEYNIQKQIIIENINNALIKGKKFTYFNSLRKEIFEKENMSLELDRKGWSVSIVEDLLDTYKFTFNKK